MNAPHLTDEQRTTIEALREQHPDMGIIPVVGTVDSATGAVTWIMEVSAATDDGAEDA